MPAWFERSIVAVGLTVAAVLVVANVVAWRDYRREDSATQAHTTTPRGSESNGTPRPPAVNYESQPLEPAPRENSRPFAGTSATATSASILRRLLVQAVRGDSWLEVRVGSQSGAIRYRGTLLEGREVRLSGERIWLRIGAGDNLDVLVDGKRAGNLPTGTATVLVTADGLETIGIG